MTDDFTKYIALKQAGSTPEEVYLAACYDKVDLMTRIRMIRSVFRISLAGAKEVVVKAEGKAASLDAYQERIATELIHRDSVKERL